MKTLKKAERLSLEPDAESSHADPTVAVVACVAAGDQREIAGQQFSELDGLWTGTVVHTGVDGVTDCRPRWWLKIGDADLVIVSFDSNRTTRRASAAYLNAFEVWRYVGNLEGTTLTLTSSPDNLPMTDVTAGCEWTLETWQVAGTVAGDAITGTANQMWKRKDSTSQLFTVAYDITLRRVKR